MQVELDKRTAERDEALEQQTATAEVLQLINSSPGDLAPVFDAILEKAHTLCGAAHGIMMIRDGERFRTVAVNGVERAFVDAIRRLDPMRPPEGSGPARLIQGEQIVHFPDLQAESFLQNALPQLRRVIEIGDVRTLLLVPLRKDGALQKTSYEFGIRPRTKDRGHMGPRIVTDERSSGCKPPSTSGRHLLLQSQSKLRPGEDDDGSSTDSRHFGGPRQNDAPATTRGHSPFDVDPSGFRSCGDRRDGRLPDPRHQDDERAGPRGERQRRQ